MRIEEPTLERAELDRRAREVGIVVHHVVVAVEPGDATDPLVLHRDAALLAMGVIVERGLPPGRDPELAPERMQSRPCTRDEFLGTHFDSARRRPIVRGRTPQHRDDHFVAGDPETPQTRVELPPTVGARAYAHAFCYPPYGIWCSSVEAGVLFRAYADELLDVVHGAPTIRAWSTDWCRWFDPGHEWWGSRFWTVQPRPDRIVAVGASTTD